MPDPSRPPTAKQYGVDLVCEGCGRKLVAKNEPALWFRGHPKPHLVFGYCCWALAAHV